MSALKEKLRNRPAPIKIVGAREHNLKNVSVEIPKKVITVFTGVSGSGKSSLVFDTVAAESQRQLNETFSSFVRHRLPHYGQPDVDTLSNLSAAIIVDQKRLGGNARSTVGTVTDIHALLRLLYSRIGTPFVGYSNVFSFNHPEGMCPSCQGLGSVAMLDLEKLLDKGRSLNEGALILPGFPVGGYRWKRYVTSGLFDNDKQLRHYSEAELQMLLHQQEMPLKGAPPGWPPTAKYEGVVPRFEKAYLSKDIDQLKPQEREAVAAVVTRGPCRACEGYRLNSVILSCQIRGKHIGQCANLQIDDLIPFIEGIDDPRAPTMVAAILERLHNLVSIGLGYLSLDRPTATMSGGESQRIKMIRHLGSSLTDMTYILDEPSIGLHPRDVDQLNGLMRQLRDKGNTVLVVEHDPDVIAIADHVIDMGPGAGTRGGEVVYQGSLSGLAKAETLTGRYLHRHAELKAEVRVPRGYLQLRNARLHNLKDVSVDIPQCVMTVVTGVAGSGKSSLISGELMRRYPTIVYIDQGALVGSRRSNTATYTGILDPIRRLFAQANASNASLFSANSAGACPNCKGLGETHLDLAFMDAITSVCEVCKGRRYTDAVLALSYRGKNIDEVLRLTIESARSFFAEQSAICQTLQRVMEVGLDYLALGQPLSTLSGGERQRIKLATELENNGKVYVLDEPTTGLHMSDVARLIALLDRLVDKGSTVIVIEHNLDVIARADWVIDMGPGAGRKGGQIVAQGTPAQLTHDVHSVTGVFLKRRVMVA
ncbi:ATP-binding cassette domain-containing protein [Janthinobacterium sp. GB4P2]|uniref:ATP-binding cassette domain-containing protein n=1 Tax=Janthinobacterium sp. GB4P2 TaxID=3424189 RepID=UPI003F235765